MFWKYFLIFILNTGPSWSYFRLPPHRLESHPVSYNVKDVGPPLILTPYIKSGNIPAALQLSNVEQLLNVSKIISHSGFLTVDEKHHSNLFFWFFRQSSDQWQKAPLVLWLQGGPGATSMYGLFEETGPFIVTKNGLEPRMWSWTNDYNVLYIDQPVGTGFSFTDPDGYINSQEQVAEHLYEALSQFFLMFPDLKKSFYISGESYGGRYVPAISYKIHTMNAKQIDINLKGLFMISAMTNVLQTGLSEFCFSLGLIDSKTKTKLEQTEQLIETFVRARMWGNATDSCLELQDAITNISNATVTDFTQSVDDGVNSYYVDFLQTADIRKKIHVGNATFIPSSEFLFKYVFRDDIGKSVVPWVEELVEHYPILFVGGQYDYNVAYPLVLRVIENLSWSGAFNYSQAERKKFTSDGKVVGYIKSAGNLIDVLMRDAGHMVPKSQPQATLELLKKFINDEL